MATNMDTHLSTTDPHHLSEHSAKNSNAHLQSCRLRTITTIISHTPQIAEQ